MTIDAIPKVVAARMVTGRSSVRTQIDYDQARLVMFVGTNPVVSHGHMWSMPDPIRRIRELRSQADVWVVDPRRTETARLAAHHLRVRPATDYALFAFLVREVLEEGADEAYVAQYATEVEELQASVDRFDANTTSTITGLISEELAGLLAAVRRAGRLSIVSGTGALFSRTSTVGEWLALALLIVTGSLDRRGGVWCQPGFFTSAGSAPRDGDGWRPDGPSSRGDLPGWFGMTPCAAMADEIEQGNLRALLVFGGNPLVAFPEHRRLKLALASLEVLVVADIAEGDMTEVATHVLPCLSQLERADLNYDSLAPAVFGQYTPRVVVPHPGRRPLWWYAREILLKLAPEAGDSEIRSDEEALAYYVGISPEEMAQVQAAEHGVLKAHSHYGLLLDDPRQPKFNLAPGPLVSELSNFGRNYDPVGLVLLPRRQLRHVNSTLRDLGGPRRDQAGIFVSPEDAVKCRVSDGDLVKLTSDSGSVTGAAYIDDSLEAGTVAVPHGFRSVNVAELTSGDADHTDPLTGMVYQAGLEVHLEQVSAHDSDPWDDV